MNKLKRTVLALCLVFALTVDIGYAQENTPEPTPTAEMTQAAPTTDTVTTVTTVTETAPSNTVQSFLAVLSGMLIDVIVPILAGLAVMLFYRAMEWVRSMMSAEQEQVVSALVRMVVQAAEQTGLNDEIANTGEAKKQFAITTLQEALRARGLGTIADSIPELEARIEAAINQEVQIPYPIMTPVAPITPVDETEAKDNYRALDR